MHTSTSCLHPPFILNSCNSLKSSLFSSTEFFDFYWKTTGLGHIDINPFPGNMNNQQLKQVSQTHLERLRAFPPAIPYQTPKKKGKNAKEQKDDDSDDESRYRKIQIKFNIDDPKSDGAEWKVPVFDHGTPEEWCKWRIELADLEVAYPFNDPTNEKQQNIKLNVIRSLLTGEARERFQRAYEEAIAEKKGDDRTTSSLNAIAKRAFTGRKNSALTVFKVFPIGKLFGFGRAFLLLLILLRGLGLGNPKPQLLNNNLAWTASPNSESLQFSRRGKKTLCNCFSAC